MSTNDNPRKWVPEIMYEEYEEDNYGEEGLSPDNDQLDNNENNEINSLEERPR